MALDTSVALTTVSAVKDDLGAVDSSAIERRVHAVSASVAAYCNRKFIRDDAIVERYPQRGGFRLALRRRPVLSIASIVDDDQTLLASDYTLEDADAGLVFRRGGWTDRRIVRWESIVGDFGVTGTEEQDIVVTYSAGYVTPAQVAAGEFETRTLPYDLEEAVIEMVVGSYRNRGRDRGVVSESLMDGSQSWGAPDDASGFPPHIARTLDRYRDLSVGI